MSKLNFSKSRLNRALAAAGTAVAATAGAGLAGDTPEVQADIINWNINQPIPLNIDGLYIKIDTQQFSGTAMAGWDINPYGATSLNFFASSTAPNPASTYVRTQAAGGPSGLALGYLVDGSSPFVNNTTAVISSANVPANGWALNSLNYFGFRFHNNTTNAINFGYGVMQVGATATARTLVSLHYENSGAGINVGAVPEPGTLGLLALGAVGLVASRRRRTV